MKVLLSLGINQRMVINLRDSAECHTCYEINSGTSAACGETAEGYESTLV